MHRLVLAFLFLGVFSSLEAQQIRVKDAQSGELLESVLLLSESPKAMITTNAKGVADISAFVGSEKIIIRRLGYTIQILSYTDIQASNFEIKLIPTSRQFDEVVISASRWNQNSGYLPSRIKVISPEEAALDNPQTVVDLLASSGEVFIQKSQQGGGSPMVRGFSTNRLLYTVDGVRMNSAIFRSGNIQNVISLDAFAIENTEVLFGPGSVIYGSDAIGGVMSFQTLSPQFSDTPKVTGNAVSRFSSANREVTNHIDIGVSRKKLASISSLTYSDFGDLRMGTRGPDEYLRRNVVKRIGNEDRIVENPNPLVQDPTGYNQINLMQKIRFQPNTKWDFQYGFHFSQTSEFSRYDRLIEELPNGLPRSAVWNYGPQIWRMNNLSITHNGFNKLYDRMSLRFAEQYFQESRIDRNFSGAQRFRLRTQLEEVQAYSINLDYEKAQEKNQWYYGLEFVRNEVTSTGTAIDIRDGSSVPVPDRYPQSTWSSYAAYLNYQHFFSDKWVLQAGGRYTGFRILSDFTRHLSFFPFDFTSSTVQNSALTGSLGLVFRPEASWKISLNTSTGFRAPNVDDIGKIFDFVGGEVIVPNTSLDAEYAYNGEVNISKFFGDRFKIDVTGFYTYLDNAMVRRPFQVGGKDSIVYNGQLSRVFAIQNAAFGTVYGFNAGLEVNFTPTWSLTTRYNYQRGIEEMDNGDVTRSRHAAPAFGVTRLTYQKDKVSLLLYAMYSAEVSFANLNEEERQKPAIYAQDENGNPYSPDWFTLNAKAMLQLHPNLSLSTGLENITNQRYRPYSSGLVAPGRNWVISIRGRF